MNPNEAQLIISNLQSVSTRLDLIDSRVAKFIENSIQIQSIQEQVKAHDTELGRIREAMVRAHSRIDEVGKSVTEVQLAPAKDTHAAVSNIKKQVLSVLCGAAATGILAALIKIATSIMKG